MFLPKKFILSDYTTLPSNSIGTVCKHVSPFVLVPRQQMIEMGEGNRFC